MTAIASVATPFELRLDIGFLRRGAFYFAGFGLLAAPFVHDPVALVGGCAAPYILLSIIDTPRMPSVAVFFLLWQWVEVVSRIAVAAVDNESINDGLYGPYVGRAFWYCLASLAVLAGALRLCIGNLPRLSYDSLTEHLSWRPSALFWAYLVIMAVGSPLQAAAAISPGLAQPAITIASLKSIALIMLFVTTLSSERGLPWALAAVAIEAGSGFLGFFSGFKEVFFIFFLSAISARVRLKIPTLITSAIASVFLVVLMLFWTAIKTEYREFVSGGSSAQIVSTPISDRIQFLLGRALSPDEISWAAAGDQLLRRVPQIDFFGGAIATMETAPEQESFAQWKGVFEHVFRPRILFPDKEALNDIDLYERLVRVNISEEQRETTSIGVGYLAENYVDFGFPMMFLPVLGLGLFYGLCVRYFLTRPVPWVAQEAFAFGCLYAASTGLGSALAKLVGGFILTFIVLALTVRFLFPYYKKWVS
jgi:hypothetical protein